MIRKPVECSAAYCSEVNMRPSIKIWVWAAPLFITIGPMTGVSAVTIEVAKTCQTLTEKAFPPRQIGNPAAGSAKGTAQDQRAYYGKCVANGGKVDDTGTKEAK
jgi:hypothetical protein